LNCSVLSIKYKIVFLMSITLVVNRVSVERIFLNVKYRLYSAE